MSEILEFKCSQCSKICKNKGGLTRHINSAHTEGKGESSSQKSSISSTSENILFQIDTNSNPELSLTARIFTNLYDILRSEGITSFSAYLNLLPFLALKTIEKYFVDETYTFNFPEDFDDDQIASQGNIIQEGIKYRFLSKIPVDKEEDIQVLPSRFTELMAMLFFHKKLHPIFPKYDVITIKQPQTFKALISKVLELPISNTETDVLGDVYENCLSRTYQGKDLGQFFTPLWVRKLIIQILAPTLNEDGTFPSFIDTTGGTGGFIVVFLRFLIALKKKIDWDYAEKKGINGLEIDANTLAAANVNLMLTGGKVFPNYHLGDALNRPLIQQYDLLASNPPFGVKGIKWESNGNMELLCPIRTNNATALFLQMIISTIKPGGKGSIVYPMGAELFGNEDSLIDIRRSFVQSCNIGYIILLPKGVFENAKGVSTCIITFMKHRNVKEFLETKNLKSKQTKNFKDENFFTSEIQYFEIKEIPKEKMSPVVISLGKVDINRIKEHEYRLDYGGYSQEEKKLEVVMGEGYRKVKLGEVCEMCNGKNITKAELVDGPYPVVGGGQQPFGMHNEYNVDENTILISKDGAYAGFVSKYKTKVFVNNSGMYFSKFNENVDMKYVWYYLKFILQEELYEKQKGMAQPHVYKEDVLGLEIILPPLEQQQLIIQQMEKYDQRIERKDKDLEDYEDDKTKYMNKVEGEKVKMREICQILNGKTITKAKLIEGPYPVIGGGHKFMGYHNEYNAQENTVIIARKGSAGFVSRYSDKVFVSDDGYYINIINNEKITMNFLYYFLKYFLQNDLYKMKKGIAQPGVNKEEIIELEIILPNMEKQNEIVKEMEKYDQRIEEAEKEKEELKLKQIETMRKL